MNWYFCVTSRTWQHYQSHLVAALESCRSETKLHPVCVCDAPDRGLLDILAKYDVQVAIRTPAFAEVFRRTTLEGFDPTVAEAHYLRLEIPLIETREEYILYTDCDVLFTMDPPLNEVRPAYIAAAPESQRYNRLYFNAGVMVMNVPACRQAYGAVQDLVLSRLKNGIHRAYSQGDLNGFFWSAVQYLPAEYNWKPYWGRNANALIVHFHGPKLHHLLRLPAEPPAAPSVHLCPEAPVELHDIFSRSPEGYGYWSQVAHRFLAAAAARGGGHVGP